LSRVKNILFEFDDISGLETNVEKTTLMPIGGLVVGFPQEITDLGFAIVNKTKCLGLRINNRAENLCGILTKKSRKLGN
jgi:hypothetical protein